MPWLSGVYPQFFWLGSLLWALEIGALRGPSQRALGHTMVQKMVKLVALATFLASQLIFMIGQLAPLKADGSQPQPCGWPVDQLEILVAYLRSKI